ncbi:MAG: mechanosensitive ion channel family protein [Xanthomonadaceae bacterium]|nr:mechanosensitive ion channel family protein [Xanthomonadaceae bacterium]
MNMSYSVPTLITIGMTVGLFVVLFFSRRFLVKRLQGNWLGKGVERIGVLFLAALSAYTVLSFSKQLQGWDTVVHRFMIIMASVQIAVFGNVAINQYVLTMIKRKAVNDPSFASMRGILNVGAITTFYVFLFLLTLNNLGVDITALVAGLGVGGIAIALAVQNLLGDLFASLTILLDKPFIVGDTIMIGDFTGEIRKIGLKNSRLMLKTGETLIVPNSDLLQSRVRNLRSRNERLVQFILGVHHETDSEKLKQIPSLIERAIIRNSLARFGFCYFTQIGDSALQFETEYWLKTSDKKEWGMSRSEINYAVIEALRSAQIEIAYPARRLYIHNNK